MTFIGYLLAELSFNMGIYRINYYFFYNVFIVMGLMLYQTFSGYNRGKMQWTIVAFGIMILYMAWFGNAVFKEANECSPYKLSPELGEVVSPNDDFEYKTRVFHFTDFGVTC
jgi:hypothetical protein